MIVIKNNGKKRMSKQLEDNIVAYIFIAPLLIGILIFFIFPFLQNFWFSFNSVNRFNMTIFIGLENYERLLTDSESLESLFTTLKYVVFSVPIGLALSLCIATLLNTKIRGKALYRTIYFLPSVTMAAAVALVWKWIYNGDYGILNSFLSLFEIEGHNWLTNSDTALYSIILVGLWSSVGYNAIILLAGMQGIARHYYEAAEIDGAGPIKRFFNITIPMVSPAMLFVVITSTMAAFRVFDTIYMMISKTNPAFYDTQTLVMMFYRYAFDYGEKGYAAAISLLIFGLILVVTIIQLAVQKFWVNYD